MHRHKASTPTCLSNDSQGAIPHEGVFATVPASVSSMAMASLVIIKS